MKQTCILGVVVVATLAARSASAQPREPVAVAYEVSFEEVINNCPDKSISLDKATVRLKPRPSRKLVVEIPRVPAMKGARGKAGKFKAQARGPASIEGVSGKFSVSGRANRDEIQFLFIVELYRDKKPLCTQSWSGNGKRLAPPTPGSWPHSLPGKTHTSAPAATHHTLSPRGKQN